MASAPWHELAGRRSALHYAAAVIVRPEFGRCGSILSDAPANWTLYELAAASPDKKTRDLRFAAAMISLVEKTKPFRPGQAGALYGKPLMSLARAMAISSLRSFS